MKKFSYFFDDVINDKEEAGLLEDCGRNGWEWISTEQHKGWKRLYFKKEIIDDN